MMRLFVFGILLFATSVCPAQSLISEKLRGIKLLSSTRQDVVRLLEQESDFPVSDPHGEWFNFESENIRIDYATGKCSDQNQDWNVPEEVVTSVRIILKDPVTKESLGIDLSKFRKQRTDPQRKGIYVLYDKTSGVAVNIHYNYVKEIYLVPTSREYSKLCDKLEIRQYYASKRWTRQPVPNNLIVDYNDFANVTNVTVIPYADDARKFELIVDAVDPENDVLTYNYNLTGGRIIGVGKRVTWDLTGVSPGTYKVVAGVDDGCGICGKYIVKTVVIR